MLTSAERKYFYHGTQTPVHLQSSPFLEPTFSRGLDEGDPILPHVFVTPDKILASIFALKTSALCFASTTAEFSFAIFKRMPTSMGVGYVYKFDQQDYSTFEQTIARGSLTGKYVSYERLDTTTHAHDIVTGLDGLMSHFKVQIYVTSSPAIFASIARSLTNAAYLARYAQLVTLNQEIRAGKLIHVNKLTGNNPIVLA
jgi:hypothetical protein